MGDVTPSSLHFAGDQRVVRELHLVDGDVVRLHLFDALDALGPVLVGLADHAGDQVDVDLRKSDLLQPLVGPEDFRRQVGPAVDLEDFVVEVLDAQRDAGDADLLERLHLFEAHRPRLALEGDFLGRLPRQVFAQAVVQRAELLGTQIRRGAPAKIGEAERPSLHARLRAQQCGTRARALGRSSRSPGRSGWCRRGSSRTGTASGRKECEYTDPSGPSDRPGRPAPGGSPERGGCPRRKTAGSWR